MTLPNTLPKDPFEGQQDLDNNGNVIVYRNGTWESQTPPTINRMIEAFGDCD